MQARRQGFFLANVGVASADRSHDFTGKFGATFTKNSVAFPAVIKRGWQKPVKVIGQKLFKIPAAHCRFGDGALEDACFELFRRGQTTRCLTGLHSVFYRAQSFMAHRAPQSMFGKRLVDVGLEYAVEVIGQPVFKIITKHQIFSSCPNLFISPCLVPRRAGLQTRSRSQPKLSSVAESSPT